jgi:hypothetical protein
MSHDSEEEANYWPGYVDALTSMVQVLAFVMMMLAMAVFVLSQSVSKHAVEAIAKAANVEVKPNSDIKQLMQTVIDKIQSTQQQPPKNEPERNPATSSSPPAPSVDQKSPSPIASAEAAEKSNPDTLVGKRISATRPHRDQASVKASSDSPRIRLSFETRSFRLEPDRVQSLAAFTETNRLVEGKRLILINAYAYSGDGALSEARRLAYYRAMMVRKQLIDRKVLPEDIRVNVLDTADKDEDAIVEGIIANDSAR